MVQLLQGSECGSAAHWSCEGPCKWHLEPRRVVMRVVEYNRNFRLVLFNIEPNKFSSWKRVLKYQFTQDAENKNNNNQTLLCRVMLGQPGIYQCWQRSWQSKKLHGVLEQDQSGRKTDAQKWKRCKIICQVEFQWEK